MVHHLVATEASMSISYTVITKQSHIRKKSTSNLRLEEPGIILDRVPHQSYCQTLKQVIAKTCSES